MINGDNEKLPNTRQTVIINGDDKNHRKVRDDKKKNRKVKCQQHLDYNPMKKTDIAHSKFLKKRARLLSTQ